MGWAGYDLLWQACRHNVTSEIDRCVPHLRARFGPFAPFDQARMAEVVCARCNGTCLDPVEANAALHCHHACGSTPRGGGGGSVCNAESATTRVYWHQPAPLTKKVKQYELVTTEVANFITLSEIRLCCLFSALKRVIFLCFFKLRE